MLIERGMGHPVACHFPERLPERVRRSSFADDSVGFPAVRDIILYLILVINVVSMAGMVAGILMHSGRGGGLSDMFGGGGGAALGSSAAERNLNRITACSR